MAASETHEELLARLASEVSVCERCRLAASRTKVVFGEGNPNSPLVLVGEGPGQNEDATGRPFVGRAGALLDECLAEAGLSRKHVYICNVLKCRASVSQEGRTRNRAPLQDELDACARWLDEQLRILQPLVIVCLGAPSASSLIHRDFRMLQDRGKFFTTCRYARYAMAALHPAFILRQDGETFRSMRDQLVQDILAARRKVIEAKKEPPLTLF